MVAWNPDVPNPNDNTPRWGRDSQPISQYENTNTFAKTLEGAGSLFETAVKGIDWAAKEGINEEVWNKVNAEREAYTGALEASYDAAGGKRPDAGPSPLTSNEPQAPAALDRSLKYVESVKNGFEAGKVNDTYYKARLTAIAKDMRSQYPGYRDYIDKKISSITGFDPANQQIVDLLADINTMAGNKQKDELKNKFFSLGDDFIKEGHPGAAKLMGAVQRGEITPEQGLQKLEEWSKPKYDLAVLERDAKTVNTRDGMSKTKVDRYFSKYISNDVANTINFLDEEGKTATVPQIREYVDKVRTGAIKNNPEMTRAYADIVDQHITRMRLKWAEHARTYRTDGGLSLIDLLGQDEINKRIDAAVAPMNRILSDLRADKPTLALSTKETVKALQDAATNRMISENPKIANNLLNTSAISAIGGETTLQKVFDTHQLAENIGPMKEYFASSAKAAAAQKIQPNPYGPVTFKMNVEDPKVVGIPEAVSADQALKNITFITDPSTKEEIKAGFAEYFFHPNNRGVLNKFGTNSAMEIWRSLTSASVSQEVARLAGKYPEVARMQRDWVEQTFGTELFSREIKDISTIQLPKGASLKYETDTNKFGLVIRGADVTKETLTPSELRKRGVEATNDANLRVLQTSIIRINEGIEGLANMAKAQGLKGEQVDAFVFANLTKLGYSPNMTNAPSMPIGHAFATAMETARNGKELLKKLQGER